MNREGVIEGTNRAFTYRCAGARSKHTIGPSVHARAEMRCRAKYLTLANRVKSFALFQNKSEKVLMSAQSQMLRQFLRINERLAIYNHREYSQQVNLMPNRFIARPLSAIPDSVFFLPGVAWCLMAYANGMCQWHIIPCTYLCLAANIYASNPNAFTYNRRIRVNNHSFMEFLVRNFSTCFIHRSLCFMGMESTCPSTNLE